MRSNPLVLMTGADEDDRVIYVDGLQMLGIQTRAMDAADLVASVPHLRPDAIVVHMTRPEEQSWELCDALLEHPESQAVPVIVLTAAVRPDGRNRERARATPNCAAFVAKPCDAETLAAVIRRVAAGERGIEVLFGYRPGEARVRNRERQP